MKDFMKKKFVECELEFIIFDTDMVLTVSTTNGFDGPAEPWDDSTDIFGGTSE